ncbi:MAG: DUF3500 domain-containing protein [Gammaproteobacteria bacterium]|nr:DUF3500 domain-containing protein [Pseudomonadales bacterium]MCP5349072.1 DUF3500 domain-containing protein [Pseudomonadales bacterium]
MINKLSTWLLASLCLVSQQAGAQAQYPDSLLSMKRIFSQGAAEAMGEPFQGVHTSAGLQTGLFPVQTTGVSTAPVVAAANAFLATLDPMELSRSHFAVDDPEWRNWSNVDVGIFARHGISLEEMDAAQKEAAWDLLRASLSARGLNLTRNIMRTEQALLDLNEDMIRYGEEKYYFTLMGLPSTTEPWGWQLDGHHLVINYFVLGDQIVMTPAFWGGEPVFTESGKYAGNVILQEEQDQGLAFMQALDAGQRSRATLSPDKVRNDQLAAANQDNLVLDYEGIPGSELTGVQRQHLLELIGLYVGNMTEPQARVHLSDIAQHLDSTWFAWIGGVDPDAVFYYRVHSPVILIEFDHQNPVGTLQKNPAGTPTRDHIHTVVRTPNGNDYGKDLLRQHLLEHPH